MRAKAVSFALALFLVSCAASRKEFRRVPKGIAEHYELQGQVIKLTADYVYIDMGKKDRLEPGWFFEVIGFDEALYHPETGRLLGKEAEV
ncbi:MAG TPA: hypothetical protein VJC03_05340, partial [bacterium]|nr:hypothetical protein [bacterium]